MEEAAWRLIPTQVILRRLLNKNTATGDIKNIILTAVGFAEGE